MSKTTDTLTAVLADTYALGVKTHAAHWNLTGPHFASLHELFGSQYEALLDAADELAERIRALGDKAPRGIASLAKLATVQESKASDGLELAKALRDDHRALSKLCAKAVKTAQEAGDEATADLLIGRIEAHDKTAWMLDASLG
jgi:starvation-inducible DNA-binding protein